jgi:alpha-amylase
VCEQRVRTTANLVGFHNAVSGTAVTQWWSSGNDQIAFGRGSAGYVAFNRSGSALSRTFSTNLPAGTYCDVANGDFSGTGCSGPTYTVNSSGQLTATVPAGGMLALHVDARTSTATPTPTSTACTSVSTTFTLTAAAGSGDTFAVVGSLAELGGWNTGSAVALTASGSGTYSATVALPQNTAFEYKYVRKSSTGAVSWEYDPNRARTSAGTCTASYAETWNGPAPSGSCSTVTTSVAVNATTTWGQNVFIVGNTTALGNWDPNSAVALSSASYPVWTGSAQLPLNTTIQYKYIKKDGGTVVWESDPNRSVNTGSGCTLALNDTWR